MLPVVCKLTLIWLALFLASQVEAGGSDDDTKPPCDVNYDVTCDPPFPTARSVGGDSWPLSPAPTTTTMRPKKKSNRPSDPNKYGLVPPFLIGASSVILIYIVSHCVYVHCCAKKKVRNAAAEQSHNSYSTQLTGAPNNTTLVFSDGPSTTSLAVRYDGAYGKTEIINATPYLLCHNNTMPAEVAMLKGSSSGISPAPEGSMAEKGGGGFLARFRRGIIGGSGKRGSGSGSGYGGVVGDEASPRPSLCSADSSGVFQMRPEADPSSISSQGERGSVCFVPVGRALSTDQGSGKKDWTPLQGFMYNNAAEVTGMKRDSSHTLVFVPVASNQPMAGQYCAVTSQPDDDVINPDVPLEGNASNMAVPLIVEDHASDPGSRESSTIEHEALIHDDITVTRIAEHAV